MGQLLGPGSVGQSVGRKDPKTKVSFKTKKLQIPFFTCGGLPDFNLDIITSFSDSMLLFVNHTQADRTELVFLCSVVQVRKPSVLLFYNSFLSEADGA